MLLRWRHLSFVLGGDGSDGTTGHCGLHYSLRPYMAYAVPFAVLPSSLRQAPAAPFPQREETPSQPCDKRAHAGRRANTASPSMLHKGFPLLCHYRQAHTVCYTKARFHESAVWRAPMSVDGSLAELLDPPIETLVRLLVIPSVQIMQRSRRFLLEVTCSPPLHLKWPGLV